MLEIPVMSIAGSDLDDLMALQIRGWSDWPARFSCNHFGTIWPCPGRGYSGPLPNIPTQENPILRFVTHRTLKLRRRGGRMFICEHGAWTYLEEAGEKWPVVEFELISQPEMCPECRLHWAL